MPLAVPEKPKGKPIDVASLLGKKLANPTLKLSTEDSISLLMKCIAHGDAEAEKAQGKDLLIFIGNTGAGKSTTVNYLCGCDMELLTPEEAEELQLGDVLESIIRVCPKAEEGKPKEVMKIGHSKTSQTFMPQIETMDGETYCDCPGFLDNRGAEINIANAVNVRNAITSAKSVRVLMLLNYASLKADRARGLKDMLKISTNLFGNADNLLSHKDSLLIGITNAPVNDKPTLERLRKFILDKTLSITETLSDRVCVFDPLDRLINGGWNRATLKEKLKNLAPITNHEKLFRTVLTYEDENVLVKIGEEVGARIVRSFGNNDYPRAAEDITRLNSMQVIGHPVIVRLIEKNVRLTERAFHDWESSKPKPRTWKTR
jgi:hypothetical protein